MVTMIITPTLAFSFTTLSFIINNQHLLMSLLCLEGMMLSLVMYYPALSSWMMMSSQSTALILLTFGACEASLGLSIMVMLSRYYGSDMLSNLSLSKC